VPASVPKSTSSVPQISVAHDIIAIKNAAGLVTAQFHGHPLRNACPDHVADGGPPEVVRDAPRTPGRRPRRPPSMVEAVSGDALASPVPRRASFDACSCVPVCRRALRVDGGWQRAFRAGTWALLELARGLAFWLCSRHMPRLAPPFQQDSDDSTTDASQLSAPDIRNVIAHRLTPSSASSWRLFPPWKTPDGPMQLSVRVHRHTIGQYESVVCSPSRC